MSAASTVTARTKTRCNKTFIFRRSHCQFPFLFLLIFKWKVGHYSNPLPSSEPKRPEALRNRPPSNGRKLLVSGAVLNSSSSVTGLIWVKLNKNSGSSVTDAEKTSAGLNRWCATDWVVVPSFGIRSRGPKVASCQSVIKGKGCSIAT